MGWCLICRVSLVLLFGFDLVGGCGLGDLLLFSFTGIGGCFVLV